MEEERNAYNILVGKPGGKERLERLWCTWENNIRMDLREIGWKVLDWIHVAQDRDQWRAVVKTILILRVSSNAGKFLTR
jgi:hypothetical protein